MTQEEESWMYQRSKKNLHIVLVLSMIGSGICLLSNFITGLMLPTFKRMFESGEIKLPNELMVAYEQYINTPQPFYLWTALLYAISLAGVILMWNIRKTGFHLYTLAQLLIPLVTVLFLGKQHLLLGDLMLTILFITYYFIAFRRLETFTPLQQNREEQQNNEEVDDDDDEE